MCCSLGVQNAVQLCSCLWAVWGHIGEPDLEARTVNSLVFHDQIGLGAVLVTCEYQHMHHTILAKALAHTCLINPVVLTGCA